MLFNDYQNVINAQGYVVPYSLIDGEIPYMGGIIAYEGTPQRKRKIHWTPIPENPFTCPELHVRYISEIGVRFPEDGDVNLRHIFLSYVLESDLSTDISGLSLEIQRSFLERGRRHFRLLYPQSGHHEEIMLFLPLSCVMRSSCKYTKHVGYELQVYLTQQGLI